MVLDVLIGLHTATGVLALLAGLVALAVPAWGRRPFSRASPSIASRAAYYVYFVALIACIGTMFIAVGVHWHALNAPDRNLDLAFSALGAYLVFRAAMGEVDFGVIALFTAAVVTIVHAVHAPVWALFVSGVVTAAFGFELVHLWRRGHPALHV